MTGHFTSYETRTDHELATNGNFHLQRRRLRARLGTILLVPDVVFLVRRPVTNSQKPARQGGLSHFWLTLLGRLHPPFDQLQQRQTAASQALAFLDFVDEGDRFVGKLKQHFPFSGLAQALAVEHIFIDRSGGFGHRRTRISSLGIRLSGGTPGLSSDSYEGRRPRC